MNKNYLLVAVIAVGVLGLMSFAFLTKDGRLEGVSSELVFTGPATNTSIRVGASQEVATATVLTLNPDRSYAMICNIGVTTANICFSAVACTFGTGIPLSAAQNTSSTPACYEINRNNLWGGAIMAVVSATTSTSTLSVVEK